MESVVVTYQDGKFFEAQTENVVDIPPGTIVYVVSCEEMDDYKRTLLKTTSSKRPFVDIETGLLWGNSLEAYVFKVEFSYILKIGLKEK